MNNECPKCHRYFSDQVKKTHHHVRPKRFYCGGKLLAICRECHDDLEKRIPENNKLPIPWYYSVVNNFLGYNAVGNEITD